MMTCLHSVTSWVVLDDDLSPQCYKSPFWNSDRQQKGSSLKFYVMFDVYRGLYFCTVTYLRRGRTLHFTRSINVTTVCETTTDITLRTSPVSPAADH